jgi:hypothetical protein
MPFIPYIRESARKHSREPLGTTEKQSVKSIVPILCLFLLFSVHCFGQKNSQLISSSISDCKEDCFIEANLTSLNHEKDVLSVKAGVNLNCGGNFSTSFEFLNGDTLNLIVYRKPSENGTVAVSSCNCYYELSYDIGDVTHKPRVVLINGQTFVENRQDAGWVSIDED